MKKIGNILLRVLVTLLVIVYVLIALVNYPIVQTTIGRVAGNKLSERSGGIVRVGSIGLNVFNNVKLRDILMVTPQGDTVTAAEKVVVRFKEFPLQETGLKLSSVSVRNTYYCFANDSTGTNLNFLTDCFQSDTSKVASNKKFIVSVDQLRLSNVHFRMSNERHSRPRRWENGVDIPRMEFMHINGKIRNVRVDRDHVTCRFENLSTVEKSGFTVDKLSMNVYVSHHGISVTDMEVRNDKTTLLLDVLLDYPQWETMSHYVDSVYMVVDFKPGTVGCMRDAAYWAPTLWGMDECVGLQGKVYGPVADLHAEEMNITFGDKSQLLFDGNIYGLPNIDTTIIAVDMHRLRTNYQDLSHVKHPRDIKMRAEKTVKTLDELELSASFIGTIHDFYAMTSMQTSQGSINAELQLAFDTKRHDFVYEANVNTNDFNVKSVADNEWLSRCGGNIVVRGVGFNPQRMRANADVDLYHATIKNQKIDHASLAAQAESGDIHWHLNVDDSVLATDMEGVINLQDSVPFYTLDGEVHCADMKALSLWNKPEDSIAVMSGTIHGKVQGKQLDQMNGGVHVDDLTLQFADRQLALQQVQMDVQSSRGYKEMEVKCDLFDLGVNGYFDYSDFSAIGNKFLAEYVPVYWTAQRPLRIDEERIADADCEFNFEWKDTSNQIQAIIPQLSIAKGTALQGNYSFEESVKLALRSSRISFGNIDLNDIMVTTRSLGSRYLAVVTASMVNMGEQTLLENFKFRTSSNRDQMHGALLWDDQQARPTKGQIELVLNSSVDTNQISVVNHEIKIHGEPWSIQETNPILMSRQGIAIDDFKLISEGHSIVANLNRQHAPADYLQLTFDQFDVQSAKVWLEPLGFDVEGFINGRFSMFGFDEVPYFTANLNVDECVVNSQPLGDVDISSSWNAEYNQLNLYVTTNLEKEEGAVTPLMATGYVSLSDQLKTSDIHFDISFDEFSMQTISPLLQSFSSRFEGLLRGDFVVDGTLSSPQIEGVAYIDEGLIKVDFLNTLYAFDDSITFSNDDILFRQFEIRDERGNKAYVTGNIIHNDFSDFVTSLNLTTDNFLFMNTTSQNNSYYGTVLASANGSIRGPFDDISINVKATTKPGSMLFVPMNNRRQVKELDYIQFVSDDYYDSENPGTSTPSRTNSNRYNLSISLDVTPDVRLNIPMDYSQMYVDIGAVGMGDLQLGVSSESPFSILGDYEIESGNMSMTLLSLINKNFNIEEGSSIKFTGSIPDAIFDIHAIYSQRVNMTSLTGMVSSTERVQSNVQVENVISLEGTLQSPSLNFDIRLPNADQSLQDEVFAYIDRTNERDMLNQTVSLLLLGQFYSNSANATNPGLLDNGLSSGYSVVANSVGSVVSNMVQVVDINFGYKAATDLTTEHYEVDINKEWNKFYLESSFGIGGDAREFADVNQDNNLVGDMLLGYKLSPRFHIFVFNRSNTNDYTRSDLPYKQGFGLKYTRDFNSVKELFKTVKKK